MTAELVVMSTQWTSNRPQSVTISASSPRDMVRPLTIAKGLDGVPDRPFKVRQSMPATFGFATTGTTSVLAQSRWEVGKNGSHPSVLLAGLVKTDLGIELVAGAAFLAGS